MLREDELHGIATIRAHFRTICIENHAFLYRIVTGSDKTVLTFHFYNTDTAGSNFIDIFQITKLRDDNSVLSRRVHDRGTFRYTDLFIVNFQIYHTFSRPPLKIPKPKWSQRRQRFASCFASWQVIQFSTPSKS